MKKVVLAVLVLAGFSTAAMAADNWVFLPGQSFESMMRGGGVGILNTETLRWTDGRNVKVTYLRTADSTFRCVSYDGESIQQSGLGCYRLAN